MRIRQRYTMFVSMFVVGGFSALLVGMFVTPLGSILVMIVFVVSALGLMSLSCPRCGATLLLRKQRIFGLPPVTVWSGRLPRACPNCGTPIE